MQNIKEIYQEYSWSVYKYLFCLTNNKDISEELTQETFAIAVKNIHKFRGECKVSSWMCQIAKHLWYKELKRKKQDKLVFIINYLKSKINTKFNLRINRNVKEVILEHIPKLEYIEFSSVDKSNVIQRVNNDATTYSEFFNSQINLFFDTIFIIIFAVAQTLQLNSTVGLFIAIICVFIILLSIWHYKISRPLIEEIVEMNKEVITKTTVSIEESKMLKIFNRKDKEIKDFAKMNKECKAKEMKLAKLRVIYVILTHSIRNFKDPFILLWGRYFSRKRRINISRNINFIELC